MDEMGRKIKIAEEAGKAEGGKKRKSMRICESGSRGAGSREKKVRLEEERVGEWAEGRRKGDPWCYYQ